jgi:hypothetical protein
MDAQMIEVSIEMPIDASSDTAGIAVPVLRKLADLAEPGNVSLLIARGQLCLFLSSPRCPSVRTCGSTRRPCRS